MAAPTARVVIQRPSRTSGTVIAAGGCRADRLGRALRSVPAERPTALLLRQIPRFVERGSAFPPRSG